MIFWHCWLKFEYLEDEISKFNSEKRFEFLVKFIIKMWIIKEISANNDFVKRMRLFGTPKITVFDLYHLCAEFISETIYSYSVKSDLSIGAKFSIDLEEKKWRQIWTTDSLTLKIKAIFFLQINSNYTPNLMLNSNIFTESSFLFLYWSYKQ